MSMIPLNEFYDKMISDSILANNQFKFSLLMPNTGAIDPLTFDLFGNGSTQSNTDAYFDGIVFSTFLKECKLPVKTIGVEEIDFNGHKVIFPGSGSNGEQSIELEFYIDSKMKNFMFIQKWIDYMFFSDSPNNKASLLLNDKIRSNFRLGGGFKKIPSTIKAHIEIFDKDHTTLLTRYILHGIFPAKCDEPRFSNDGRADLSTMSTTWYFQYWEVESYILNDPSKLP